MLANAKRTMKSGHVEEVLAVDTLTDECKIMCMNC